MKQATRALLNDLNLRFYARSAEAWDASRTHPWRGLQQALGQVPVTRSTVRVLDLGAGNGRSIPELRARFGSTLDYCGLDASGALLMHARARHAGSEVAFTQADFVLAEPHRVLPTAPVDLVLLVAVLHHVPAEAARIALLRAAVSRLVPGGVLIATIWHYDEDPRFASRCVPPATLIAEHAPALEFADLELGDAFVRFGAGREAIRYCHFPDQPEVDRWLCATPATLRARFRADGAGDRQNEYLVLTRASP